MSEANQVSDLLQITARLTGILKREVEMLRAMKPADILSLQQDKIVLSTAYESRIKSMKSNPEILRAIPPALRADLKAMVGAFRAVLSENERSLRAAKETTESALRAIAEEVQAKTRKHAGYSAKGALATPDEARRSSALSLAFDQLL